MGDVNLASAVAIVAAITGIILGYFQITDLQSKFVESTKRLANLEQSLFHERVLQQWKEEHPDLLQDYGRPGTIQKRIGLWFQFFARGYALYNVSDSWTVLLDLETLTWTRVENPEALISQHGVEFIDYNLLEKYRNGRDTEIYRNLIDSQQIIGGIGTIYVRENLFPTFGSPLHSETFINDAVFIEGPLYDLMVAVMNRHTDSEEGKVRAVIVLFRDGKFKKHTVVLRDS